MTQSSFSVSSTRLRSSNVWSTYKQLKPSQRSLISKKAKGPRQSKWSINTKWQCRVTRKRSITSPINWKTISLRRLQTLLCRWIEPKSTNSNASKSAARTRASASRDKCICSSKTKWENFSARQASLLRLIDARRSLTEPYLQSCWSSGARSVPQTLQGTTPPWHRSLLP